MITRNFMNIKGQGHSLTFVQGVSDSTFSNFFYLETARPIEAKFPVEPPWNGIMKVSTNGLCHIPKWLPCPYMVKNFKNLLLSNQKADDLESWYAELVSSTTKFVQMMTLG